jgi:glycosyltransferase involved in cell wall biosynthesis
LNADTHFYGRVPSSSQPLNTQRLTPVCVGAPFAVYDGYGSLSEYVVLSLQRAGAQVNVHPFNLDRRGLPAELLDSIDRSPRQPASPALCFTWPLADFSQFYGLQDVVISTMWETSRMPAGWAPKINWARAIVVPSRFNAEMFRQSGVTRPVEVVPLGVDPAVYNYIDRPERSGLTTLTVGTFVPRKNIEIGIAAWKLAFGDDPDARLIIKTRFGVTRYVPDDPRIRFVDAEETTHGIVHWYREADVLMALGNEGFGLPLVEGMATGLPVIALSSEGQGDVCEDAPGLVLDVPPAKWTAFNQAPFGDCGVRGVPSPQEVAQRLRWVHDHRQEARELGKAASEWAVRNRSVWSMGPLLLDVLERHCKGKRLLRRSAAICMSSETAATEFGWAAEDLAAACGLKPQDLGSDQHAAVLHLVYAPGVTDESALASAVRRARRRGQPVCVIEYVPASAPTAWEMDASVLLAPTSEAVAVLRRRWPQKRVELLPLGCPAPNEVSKSASDGSIAIWCEEAEALSGLTANVRVRLITGATRECIQKTLSEGPAAVALWQQSSETPRASYLARICLASGVPVLTSQARQFIDVSDVTYQPASLAGGLNRLLQDDCLRASLSRSARSFCSEWSHARVAKLASALWQGM